MNLKKTMLIYPVPDFALPESLAQRMLILVSKNIAKNIEILSILLKENNVK